MFERTTLHLISAAAASAAAALAVFALGFALFALVQPIFGPAGAAATVAAAAALGVGAFGLAAAHRAERRALEAERMRAHLADAIPQRLGAFAAERPLLGLAATLAAGFVAARYPGLCRDILSALGAAPDDRR